MQENKCRKISSQPPSAPLPPLTVLILPARFASPSKCEWSRVANLIPLSRISKTHPWRLSFPRILSPHVVALHFSPSDDPLLLVVVCDLQPSVGVLQEKRL
jgi:hypothetical protein